MSDDDPHGDRAWLSRKRTKAAPASLDPHLPPIHTETPDTGERPPTPAERARELIKREQVSYRFLDGHSEVVSSRTVAAIELLHIDQMRPIDAANTLGISRYALQRAISAEKANKIRRDMLERLKTGVNLHAWAGLIRLSKAGTKDDGVKLGALNSILDRIEGKAIQRVSVKGSIEHTHRMVTQVRPAEELEQLALKLGKDGVFSLPEE